MRLLSRAALIAGVVICSACYHATIEMGRPASGQVVARPWANSFIYGLVPPPTWEAAHACPNGVARVETLHSFLNGLVGALTLGIYTPMTLQITCAAAGSSDASSVSRSADTEQVISIDRTASLEKQRATMSSAAALAISTRAPVYVRF
jgi:Bor protein